MSISLTSGLSAVTTDAFGVSHIVWSDGGFICHAIFNANSGTWEQAEAIAATGTETISTLNIVANSKLIDGQNPGVAVVWQQGGSNNSDFYYTAAQYNSTGSLQWLQEAQPLTSDDVADVDPTVATSPSGEVVVIGSKSNLNNAANQSIQEDTDLYNQTFRISSSQFATVPAAAAPTAPYSPPLVNNGLVNIGALQTKAESSSAPSTAATASASSGAIENLDLNGSTPEAPGFFGAGQVGTQISFTSNLLSDFGIAFGVPETGFFPAFLNVVSQFMNVQGTLGFGKTWGNLQWPQEAYYINSNTTMTFQKTKLPLNRNSKSWVDKFKEDNILPEKGVGKSVTGLLQQVNPGTKVNPEANPNNLNEEGAFTFVPSKISPITIALNLDTGYYYQTDSPYNLESIINTLGLTAQVTWRPYFSGAIRNNIYLSLTGGFGVNLRFTSTPSTPGGNYFPHTFQPGLEVTGAGMGAFAILSILSRLRIGYEVLAAQLAVDAGKQIASWLAGTSQGLNTEALLIFPIVSINGQGGVYLSQSLKAQVSAQLQAQLNWSKPMDIQLSFTPTITISLGGLGINASYNIIETIPLGSTPASSSSNNQASASSPTTDNTQSLISTTSEPSPSTTNAAPTVSASAAGSLVVVDFGVAIRDIPPASDFTITTSSNGRDVTPFPVFDVIAGSTNSQVILRLERPIPGSEIQTYTSRTQSQTSTNTISLAFTNSQAITDTSGTALSNLTDLVVSRKPTTTLAPLQFNPVSGNSEDYTSPTLYLSFNTALATSVNPSLNRFTVTSGGQTLTPTAIVVKSYGISLIFDPTVTNTLLQNATVSYSNSNGISGALLQDSATHAIASFTIQNGVSLQYSPQTSITPSTVAVLFHESQKLSTTASDYVLTATDSTGAASSTINIQSITVKGNQVTLVLGEDLGSYQQVSLTYQGQTVASSIVSGMRTPQTQSLNPAILSDLANDSAPIILWSNNSPLVAWTSDAPCLEPIAGIVNNQREIILTFADLIGNGDNLPSIDQFTVVDSTGASHATNNISINGNTLALTLAEAVPADVALSVSYQLSAAPLPQSNLYLSNSYANTNLWVSSFSGFSLVNSGTDSNNAPAVVSAASTILNNTSNKIIIAFDQALVNQGVSSGDFSVTSNGQVFTIADTVTVDNNTVTLTVQPPAGANLIGLGDIVSVSYTGGTALKGSQGNGAAPSFSGQRVRTTPSNPATLIKVAPFSDPSARSTTGLELGAKTNIPGTSGLNLDPTSAYDPTTGNTVMVWTHVDSQAIDHSNMVPGQYYDANQAALMGDNFKQSDLYYSILTPSSTGGTWSLAAPLTQQLGADTKVAIGAGPNNQLMAAWLHSSHGVNTLYYSSLSYSNQVPVWSTPQVLYEEATPDALTELSIVTIDQKPTVLWTQTQRSCYALLTADASPLLYYRLAEASGTTLVNIGSYGGGGNGTYSGSVTLNQLGALENTATHQGDPNPAALFNAGGTATSTVIPLSGTSFSVEGWFQAPSLSTDPIQLMALQDLLSMQVTNTGISVNLNGTTLQSKGFTPSANQWHYVVVTYDGISDKANLVIDGQNAATTSGLKLSLPSSTVVTLASTANTSAVYLDEVALYSQALADTGTAQVTDISQASPSDFARSMLDSSGGIGEKYLARYVDPLPPGPNTRSISYNGSTWQKPGEINPIGTPVPTQLSDSNPPAWDVTSYLPALKSSYVSPNGNPDRCIQLSLGNQVTSRKITAIVVSTTNSKGSTISWSIGGASEGHQQLAVAQADRLLNPINPEGSFEYTILSPSVNLDLFFDAGNQTLTEPFKVTVNYSNDESWSTYLTTTNVQANQSIPTSGQALAIATVTEADDSSLSLIDSGFIINTAGANMGYGMTSGDFNNDGQLDVAVANRGFTNQAGVVQQGGTVQILFNGGNALSGSEATALSSKSLAGNPGGVFIKGLMDGGAASGNLPVSMATGDLNGDDCADLAIGDPNSNKVYVVYGSSTLAGTTIDVTTLASSAGYVVEAPADATANSTSGASFGYSVAIGNFNSQATNGIYSSDTKYDLVIGAPNANTGSGAVYVAYDGSPNAISVYTSTNPRESAGFSVAVSSVTSNSSTFTNNKTSDDLIIGAPGYQGSVTNQWSGLSDLPSNTNSNPDGPPAFPASSTVALGAVYVYQSKGTASPFNDSAYSTYIGPSVTTNNGTGDDVNAGSALASVDLNGDAVNDLAIAAPGGASNNGTVFVLSGGVAANSAAQSLGDAANLQINGGIAFGQLGSVVTAPGDINDDGIEDLLTTTSQAANSTGQGYLIFGNDTLLSGSNNKLNLSATATANKSTFLLNGDQPYQMVGAAAAGIGDVNGDNIDDLMISAPNARQLYTIYGHPWLADDGSIKLADISGNNGFVTDGDLFINKKMNYNAIFQVPNQQINTAPCLVNGNGILYLAYTGAADNYIYLTSSANYGVNWSQAIQLPSSMTTTTTPSLVYYHNTLYLAYQGINGQLNITSSSDNGQTWSTPVTLNQWSSNGFALTVDPSNGQFTVFFVSDNSSDQILYMSAANPLDPNSWGDVYNSGELTGSDQANTIPNQVAGSAISALSASGTNYIAYKFGSELTGLSDYIVTYPQYSPDNGIPTAWNVAGLPYNGYSNPNLINNNGLFYLIFADGNQNVSWSTSSNATDWSSPQTISNQTSYYMPSGAFVDEQLYIAYAGENQNIYVTALGSPTLSLPLYGNGNDVVIAGDVNGDGFADVLSGGSPYGGVLTFGESTKSLIDAAAGTDDIVINVANTTVSSFTALGDINADGLSDMGIIDYNNNFYLQLGSTNTLPYGSTLTLGTPYGSSVYEAAAVGDVNGDGYGDAVLMTASNSWNLYSGNQSGGLSLASSTPNFVGSVSNGLGDVNGDGVDDIGFGNPQANSGNGQYTLYGSGITQTFNPPNAAISAKLSSWLPQSSPSGQSTGAAPSVVEYNGWLYMVYNSTDNDTLWMQKSSDGIHWEGLTNLGSNFETYFQPSLAVFNNTLYLSFTATNSQGQVILASAIVDSSPLGLTFSGGSFYQVAGNSSSNGPTLVTYDDSLYVFFLANNSSNSILYASSPNPSSSSSWSGNGLIPTNAGSNSSSDRVGAAVYDGNLYVAFLSSDSNDLYITSYDGTTWASADSPGSNLIIPGQTSQSGPTLVATSSMLYMFYSSNNSNESICYTASPSGNSSDWDALNTIPNQSSADRPTPVAFNQSIYVYHMGYDNESAIYGTASNPINETNQDQSLASDLQGIGDFNGDGREDYAVLASGYSSLGGFNNSIFENNQGAVYIYYGNSSAMQDASVDVVLNPYYATNPSGTGISVLSNFSALGDINGDGFDDIAIASPSTSVGSDTTADGIVYVVFGGQNWGTKYTATSPFDLNKLSRNQSNSNSNNYSSNGFLITGLPAARAGTSLGGGGDVNGDGLNDFMIGAPGDNDNLSYTLMGSDFTDTISQTGTIGDDVMQGTPTGESFLGDLGDDQIYTKGGIDVVYAGPGEDLVTVHDTYFRRLDGGPGIDALLLEGYNGQAWDLTTLSPGSRVRNFEILVTSDYGANTLTLNSVTIMQMTSGNTLSLQMDAEDTLVLSPDFTFAGKTYGGNQYYDLYTSNSSAARVLLNRITNASDENVIRVLTNAPTRNAPKPLYESESLLQNNQARSVAAADESTGNDSQDLAVISSGLTLGDPNAATTLSITNPRANEADGQVSFTIQRSGDLQKYVLIDYSTQDGDAMAGLSYCPVAGQLLFAPGETQKSVSVPLINNHRYVGDRQFGLLVSIVNEYQDSRGERPVELQLLANAHGEAIRRWSNGSTRLEASGLSSEMAFDVTTTEGGAKVDLNIEGYGNLNTFYSRNASTGKYEELIYNGQSGAFFLPAPSDNASSVRLVLQDGNPADGDGAYNGLVKFRGYAGRVIPGLTSNNNKTFWAPTAADGHMQFRLIDAPADDYEFGWLKVDGINGQISDGSSFVLPDDRRYHELLASRLADQDQKIVLFQGDLESSNQALTPALANQSFHDGSVLTSSEGQFFGQLTEARVDPNQYLVLYSLVDGKATFSSLESPVLSNQGRGFYQLNFGGVSAEMVSQAIVIPGDANTLMPTDILLSRAASYNHTVALYRVDDLVGGIDIDGDRLIDFTPGDDGYALAALNRARDPVTGHLLTTPANFSTSQQRVNLLGSGMYGVLLIPKFSIDDILRDNPDNQARLNKVAFFSFNAANPDGMSHASRLAQLTYGFEDQLYGGDSDFNDMNLKIVPVL